VDWLQGVSPLPWVSACCAVLLLLLLLLHLLGCHCHGV
jgi:hypothetical protein